MSAHVSIYSGGCTAGCPRVWTVWLPFKEVYVSCGIVENVRRRCGLSHTMFAWSVDTWDRCAPSTEPFDRSPRPTTNAFIIFEKKSAHTKSLPQIEFGEQQQQKTYFSFTRFSSLLYRCWSFRRLTPILPTAQKYISEALTAGVASYSWSRSPFYPPKKYILKTSVEDEYAILLGVWTRRNAGNPCIPLSLIKLLTRLITSAFSSQINFRYRPRTAKQWLAHNNQRSEQQYATLCRLTLLPNFYSDKKIKRIEQTNDASRLSWICQAQNNIVLSPKIWKN